MSAVALCFVAGFATSSDFMRQFASRMERRYEEEGIRAVTRHLFPYGDWSTSRWSQIAEIRKDLMEGGIFRFRTIGGERLADALAGTVSGEERVVLIGHSAGGLASVHAAKRLLESGLRLNIKIVQIGSPKCPIPEAAGPSNVLYIYGTNRNGKRADPVTRLGRWGKRPPKIIEGIPIVGGHTDYFRSRYPFIDGQGRTNLDVVTDCVWSWLAEQGS